METAQLLPFILVIYRAEDRMRHRSLEASACPHHLCLKAVLFFALAITGKHVIQRLSAKIYAWKTSQSTLATARSPKLFNTSGVLTSCMEAFRVFLATLGALLFGLPFLRTCVIITHFNHSPAQRPQQLAVLEQAQTPEGPLPRYACAPDS